MVFANENKIDSLLVLSGCTSEDKAKSQETVQGEGKPTYIQPKLNFNN
jgi:ribonucleotide monophosphatase NagD (HAD superfamily)